jgi:hypothetical protein
VGLAVGLGLGRADHGEPVGDAEPGQRGVDDPPPRRRRHRDGQPLLLAGVEGIVHTWQGLALGGHEVLDGGDDPVGQGGVVGVRPGAAGVPVGHHLIEPQAHRLDHVRHLEAHPDLTEPELLGLLPQRLRIDEQPVEVEDHGIEHGR